MCPENGENRPANGSSVQTCIAIAQKLVTSLWTSCISLKTRWINQYAFD